MLVDVESLSCAGPLIDLLFEQARDRWARVRLKMATKVFGFHPAPPKQAWSVHGGAGHDHRTVDTKREGGLALSSSVDRHDAVSVPGHVPSP